ncbi:MoaD/ThiS family protein [Hydrogenimonas sp.]
MPKITVEFLGPIGLPPKEMEAKTLAEVAQALQKEPEVAKWLAECAVAVNDTLVQSLETELKENDRVSLLPPVCGG